MRRTLISAWTALSLATAAGLAAGAEYSVSPAGSDANACTLAAPCRQIRRALTLVAAGDTIRVADGSYLGFDVDGKHGTASAPITIKARGTGALVLKTTDRGDNRDTIFITDSSFVVIDGLRASSANRAGVRVSQSPNVVVRNGVFGNNGTWGIFSDFADDLLLENNECFGSVAEHGIYVSNSGDRPVVRRNRVHDNNASGIQLNADLSAGGDGIITGALIEDNVIFGNGTAGGAAINLDGVQNSIVRNNVLYGNRATGIVNYQGDGGAGPQGMKILHNTVDMPANARWALLFNDTTGTNLVRNNILYNRDSFRGGITYLTPADAANTDSDYNVLERVTTDDGDTVLTLAQWQAQGHELHSFFVGDTNLWVSPGSDYHLRASSTAVDKGPLLSDATRDRDGHPRPWAVLSDIGAYEVVTENFAVTTYASGLVDATAMQFAPDGRLFVCQQAGALRVVKNGVLLGTPFVSLTVDSGGERGLLGVAFDPDFASNQFVYVYYTVPGATAHNRVSRFTANGDVAAAGSEVVILELNSLSAGNHNGGALHFGPDGRLYVAVGENGNGANAQTLGNLLGKMLRINKDGTPPPDNPFFATASGINRAIWALGLRNPFTFDFQPGTGRMFINDVGQSTWEEINDGIAGSNYGWPASEGGEPPNAAYRNPLYRYNHSTGEPTGCAITGGAFYNPATVQFPSDYIGDYFFSDFCGGFIWRYDPASGAATLFTNAINGPVDLKIGTDGSLFYLARGDGKVYRVQNTLTGPALTCPTTPVAAGANYPTTVNVGNNVQDWLGQYTPGSPDSAWIGDFKYVPLPRPATVTMTAPATAGTYDLRLFARNGFGLIGACSFEVVPTPSLSINDVTVTEGNSGTVNASFTVTLAPTSGGTVTVNWATANGTAAAPSDYGMASGSLTFASGESSKTVTVAVNGDTTSEATETFFVNLSGASGAVLLDAQGRGTITNDDVPPALTCPSAPVPPNGSYTTTVSAGSSAKDWVAQYATGAPNSPWIGGFRYVPLPRPATVTLSAPATSGTYDLRLFANDTFTVIGSCTFQVAGAPALSISDATVTEGNAATVGASFTVTLFPAAPGPVTVNWATANGTAAAPSDYASATGSLTFATGETSKTVIVTVNGDTTPEPNETFFVNLSGPSGASLSDTQGQGTITNDDGPPPAVNCPASSVSPGASYNASVVAGSSATDWLAQYTPGAPNSPWIGTYKYVPLPRPATVAMMAPATSGNYELRLFANDTFTLIGSCTFQVMGPPALTIDDVTVTEGNSGTASASFAVTLFPTATSAVTVSWATANGTAVAPGDYVSGSGSLSFAAGESTKTVTVLVNGDTTGEANETFFVNLSGATGASISDSQGRGTITNDDGAPPVVTCPSTPVTRGTGYMVTVTGGSAAKDWVAQYTPASPNSPWIGQYMYVPLPRPATVTLTAPGIPGNFEVRLFANDAFTLIGSCPVAVQ